ncbi:hypothetical protein FA809_23110 [Salmonella enterica]|nr:hypothetical protein [Salmonella enterica]EIX3308878.1 hypothetical protein [Salmonella enterica]
MNAKQFKRFTPSEYRIKVGYYFKHFVTHHKGPKLKRRTPQIEPPTATTLALIELIKQRNSD